MMLQDHRRAGADGAVETPLFRLALQDTFQIRRIPQVLGAGDAARQHHQVIIGIRAIGDQGVGYDDHPPRRLDLTGSRN